MQLKHRVCDVGLQISGDVVDHHQPRGSSLGASALDVHQHSYFCMQELHTEESFTLQSQHSGGYRQILEAQQKILGSLTQYCVKIGRASCRERV